MTPRVLALIAFRNEENYLPGYFAHLSPFVDGFLAVDDCSTDASYAIAAACSKTISIGCPVECRPTHGNEVLNRKWLLNEAHRNGAHYLLMSDADERFETRFLQNLHQIIEQNRTNVGWLQIRDCWNAPEQYRIDPPWNSKFRPCLMPCYPVGEYHQPGLLHTRWTPPRLDIPALKSVLPYNLYHLRSIHEADRAKRVQKFNEVDKAKHYQADYDYLNSEQNMVLESIPPGREYFR